MSRESLTCAEAGALAPDLALGTLDGEERAALLSHLAGCGTCREAVDELAQVADRLLLLAAPAEPPSGFESRVMSAIPRLARAERAARRRRHVWRGRVAIAAVALVAALVGAGLALVAGPEESGGEVHTALARDEGGRWTCRALAYGTDPAWLFVSLDRQDRANRSYTVELRRVSDSAPVSVGDIVLHDGHGSLATPLEGPADELHSIRMLDDTGRVRYEAEFRPSSF